MYLKNIELKSKERTENQKPMKTKRKPKKKENEK